MLPVSVQLAIDKLRADLNEIRREFDEMRDVWRVERDELKAEVAACVSEIQKLQPTPPRPPLKKIPPMSASLKELGFIDPNSEKAAR